MSQLQYIGARYVPIWYQNSQDNTSDWEINVEYEPLTFVTSQNNHLYLSKKEVPDNIGSPADNTEYWLDMGVFSAGGAIQDLQDQIDALDLRCDGIDDAITLLQSQVSTLLSGGGRQVLIISDSYGEGYTPDGNVTPFIDYFETAMGDELTYLESSSLGGAGLLGDQYSQTNYYTLLDNLTTTISGQGKDLEEITDIMFIGFANDANFTDLTVIPTRMQAIQTYCNTNYPNAKIWFGACGCKAGNPNYNNKMFQVLAYLRGCFNYGINYMQGFDILLHNKNLMSSDYLHPNATGQKNIGNAIATILRGGSLEYRDVSSGVVLTQAANMNVHSDTFKVTQLGDRIQLYKETAAHWSPASLNLTFNLSFSLVVGTISHPLVCGNGVDATTVPALVRVGGRFYQCSLQIAIFAGQIVLTGPVVTADGSNYLSGICDDIQVPQFTLDISALT